VFPDFYAGNILRGFRSWEEMTQAELAGKVGVKAYNISEMDGGKGPIGKDMAKRLARVFRVNFNTFP
jgi:plasmid maintenance system antidote protein VapI